MSNKIDYLETFVFPDIPGQQYPVYVRNYTGKISNFKASIYPSPTSAKRYTRKKQLKMRSTQAKIFDALINVGFFDPLPVFLEFPVPIQGCYRLEGQKRLYYMLDYYFPTLHLAVELDSEYHDNQYKDPDTMRDEYLKKVHGIQVFRIRDLQKASVQKGRFRELTSYMRSLTPDPVITPLIFTTDIREWAKNNTKEN